MRLRNIPIAKEVIAQSDWVIKDEKEKKGRWKEVFQNDNPIYIEVGMGKGKFIIEMAKKYPDRNFIGIERYESVLLRAIQKIEKEEDAPANLRFLRLDAKELPEVFAPGEVEGIYLNFSDPWPKDRHAKRRLTSKEFLARYKQIIEPHHLLEFKTDNKGLFDFSLESAKEAEWTVEAFTFDLHHDDKMNKDNVMTEYEEKFSSQGNKICKMIAYYIEKA